MHSCFVHVISNDFILICSRGFRCLTWSFWFRLVWSWPSFIFHSSTILPKITLWLSLRNDKGWLGWHLDCFVYHGVPLLHLNFALALMHSHALTIITGLLKDEEVLFDPIFSLQVVVSPMRRTWHVLRLGCGFCVLVVLHCIFLLSMQKVLCLVHSRHTWVVLRYTFFIFSFLLSKFIDIKEAKCGIYHSHRPMISLLIVKDALLKIFGQYLRGSIIHCLST